MSLPDTVREARDCRASVFWLDTRSSVKIFFGLGQFLLFLSNLWSKIVHRPVRSVVPFSSLPILIFWPFLTHAYVALSSETRKRPWTTFDARHLIRYQIETTRQLEIGSGATLSLCHVIALIVFLFFPSLSIFIGIWRESRFFSSIYFFFELLVFFGIFKIYFFFCLMRKCSDRTLNWIFQEFH